MSTLKRKDRTYDSDLIIWWHKCHTIVRLWSLKFSKMTYGSLMTVADNTGQYVQYVAPA